MTKSGGIGPSILVMQTAENRLRGYPPFRGQSLAANDDYIQYSSANYVIWRYRVYGAGQATDDQGNPNTADPYNFYEIVMPSQQPATTPASGSGIDWYRPMWENGNVLSYPADTTSGLPADLSPHLIRSMDRFPPV